MSKKRTDDDAGDDYAGDDADADAVDADDDADDTWRCRMVICGLSQLVSHSLWMTYPLPFDQSFLKRASV